MVWGAEGGSGVRLLVGLVNQRSRSSYYNEQTFRGNLMVPGLEETSADILVSLERERI